jgi:hypothetical protein
MREKGGEKISVCYWNCLTQWQMLKLIVLRKRICSESNLRHFSGDYQIFSPGTWQLVVIATSRSESNVSGEVTLLLGKILIPAQHA